MAAQAQPRAPKLSKKQRQQQALAAKRAAQAAAKKNKKRRRDDDFAGDDESFEVRLRPAALCCWCHSCSVTCGNSKSSCPPVQLEGDVCMATRCTAAGDNALGVGTLTSQLLPLVLLLLLLLLLACGA
jgi:hypothetical protein